MNPDRKSPPQRSELRAMVGGHKENIEMMIALSVFAVCYGFWLWRNNSLFL